MRGSGRRKNCGFESQVQSWVWKKGSPGRRIPDYHGKGNSHPCCFPADWESCQNPEARGKLLSEEPALRTSRQGFDYLTTGVARSTGKIYLTHTMSIVELLVRSNGKGHLNRYWLPLDFYLQHLWEMAEESEPKKEYKIVWVLWRSLD